MAKRQTAIVDADSVLVRNKWVVEGLLQKKSTSFWAPYTGLTQEAIIYQKNDTKAKDGLTVVFDYRGNLSGQPIKGKDRARGKGEAKKKFSDTVTIDRYRFVVDNGDSFDGRNIGDLAITEHTDSRDGLSDLYIRAKDQGMFDTLQGFNGLTVAPHRIFFDASSTPLSYQNLANMELTLKTSQLYDAATAPNGYSLGTTPSTALAASAAKRSPLAPFRLKDGKAIWLVVVDAYTAYSLKSNTVANSGVVPLAALADLRGMENLVFTGIIGMIGSLLIVEAPAFFGASDGSNGLHSTKTEISGLRLWDSVNAVWQGDPAYVNAGQKYSRSLILGANAMHYAMGKMPDYKFEWSDDFKINSESALEVWYEMKKVKLTAESTDYVEAKRANTDYGVIPLDIKLP